MAKVPASAGWSWIRDGFAVFRKQPGGLLMLMLAYLLVGALLGFIPYLGTPLTLVLAPVFTAVFMQACAAADRGVRILPEQLQAAFSKPAFPRLAALGSFYLLMLLLLVGLALLLDGDTLRKVSSGELKADAPAVEAAGGGIGGVLVFALSLPIAMASFFAAPLIFWQQMGLGKALFFSFFTVLRAWKAFILYFASWFALFVSISGVLTVLLGRTALAMAVIQSLFIMLVMIVNCSVYAAYRDIFGLPGQPAPERDDAA